MSTERIAGNYLFTIIVGPEGDHWRWQVNRTNQSPTAGPITLPERDEVQAVGGSNLPGRRSASHAGGPRCLQRSQSRLPRASLVSEGPGNKPQGRMEGSGRGEHRSTLVHLSFHN